MTPGGEISAMENLVIIAGAIALLAIVLLAVIACGALAVLLPALCLGFAFIRLQKNPGAGIFPNWVCALPLPSS